MYLRKSILYTWKKRRYEYIILIYTNIKYLMAWRSEYLNFKLVK